jgi:hypothetical protein
MKMGILGLSHVGWTLQFVIHTAAATDAKAYSELLSKIIYSPKRTDEVLS